jgi:hypothetical protein
MLLRRQRLLRAALVLGLAAWAAVSLAGVSPLELKGKAQPVEAFSLVSVSS